MTIIENKNPLACQGCGGKGWVECGGIPHNALFVTDTENQPLNPPVSGERRIQKNDTTD